jgi:hypothetical protein
MFECSKRASLLHEDVNYRVEKFYRQCPPKVIKHFGQTLIFILAEKNDKIKI